MPNTAETAETLLGVLTDDELARYGEIARDQATHELRNWGLQALLGFSAIGAAAWGAASVEFVGIGRSAAWALGAAAALGYWPYRRVKNWSLWQRHVKAVNAERARRQHHTDHVTD
jgi:hypothetical protein